MYVYVSYVCRNVLLLCLKKAIISCDGGIKLERWLALCSSFHWQLHSLYANALHNMKLFESQSEPTNITWNSKRLIHALNISTFLHIFVVAENFMEFQYFPSFKIYRSFQLFNRYSSTYRKYTCDYFSLAHTKAQILFRSIRRTESSKM